MNKKSNRTILTIEDSGTFRNLIRMTLEFEGFKVIEASDGQSGLDLARRKTPDLIVLDLMMPGLDGLQVCQQLKASPGLQAIPIVLLSSSDDSDDIEACLQHGAQSYLMKPFRPTMLIDVVRQYLPPADTLVPAG
ncbi:MAG: response regulator [Comamonadaceae bacterium]|nr:response regulator [Comamonadaceae bacterium]